MRDEKEMKNEERRGGSKMDYNDDSDYDDDKDDKDDKDDTQGKIWNFMFPGLVKEILEFPANVVYLKSKFGISCISFLYRICTGNFVVQFHADIIDFL